jgi:mitofusin 2
METAFAASAYIIHQIPNSLPPRLAAKISTQLAELDYVHANSSRITTAVRRVLRVPADNLRVGLDHSVKELGDRREETVKTKGESERAAKFFRELARKSDGQRHTVLDVDLDAPPPGLETI